jgi:hypothetical protein
MLERISICCAVTALACSGSASASKIGVRPFKIVPAEQKFDSLPPSAPLLELAGISRGHGEAEVNSEGLYLWDPQKRTGTISLRVSGAVDDRTPADSLGYKIVHVSGELPYNMLLPSQSYLALKLTTGKCLYIYWDDDPIWEQDAFAFEIAVVTFDWAGNESPRSNIVRVTHDGDLTESRQKWLRRAEEQIRIQRARADSMRTLDR